MTRRLSTTTRRELTKAVGERYRRSDRNEKREILDEFVQVTGYHLLLIHGAGFITKNRKPAPSGIYFRRLTWAGHYFLNSVRSPDVWHRTKQAATAAGGFTVDLLVLTAKSYLEAQIKGLIGG